jgi:hypothetical protein
VRCTSHFDNVLVEGPRRTLFGGGIQLQVPQAPLSGVCLQGPEHEAAKPATLKVRSDSHPFDLSSLLIDPAKCAHRNDAAVEFTYQKGAPRIEIDFDDTVEVVVPGSGVERTDSAQRFDVQSPNCSRVASLVVTDEHQ